MKKIKAIVGSLIFCLATGSLAQAQATRTWISGLGDDVNPCSRTAPCKTFARAISKTAAGGEIDALDPAGYGAVTVTKAITLDGGAGQVASILVSGTNGVTVNAGANDVVTIRNLSFQGLNAGLSGIKFLAGKALHVDHCRIQAFTLDGIHIEPSLGGFQAFITDTISQDNGGNGLYAIGLGDIMVTVDNTRFDNNVNGIFGADSTRFSIRNSAANGNSQAGFLAQANGGTVKMAIVNSTAANNTIGVKAGGGASSSIIRLAGVSMFVNGSGMVSGANGTITSFGTNQNSGSGAPNVSELQQ